MPRMSLAFAKEVSSRLSSRCLAGAWEEPNRRSWPILGSIFKHLKAKR